LGTHGEEGPHSREHRQNTKAAPEPVNNLPYTPHYAGLLVAHAFGGLPFRILTGIAIRASSMAKRMASPS
jgi:hypothetical protein